MTVRLTWHTDRAPSCWHACAALAAGESLVDPALAEMLAPHVADLSAALEPAGAAPKEFLGQLAPLCLGTASSRELALLALTKALGRERAAETVDSIAGPLGAVRRAYDAARPNLADELALRAGPITEQWEARGAGLLAGVKRLAEEQLIPAEARIALVEPVLGGAGTAFPRSNVATFEALLANPEPRLPEVLRVAWLVAQLNLDLPCYTDCLHAARLQRAAELALVPLVLAAAEHVELARSDRATMALAFSTWRVRDSAEPYVADVVDAWWQVYADSRSELPAALVALDQMLEER